MATRDFLIRILGETRGLDRAVENAEQRIAGLGGRLRGALGGLVAGFSVKSIIDASLEAEKAVSDLDAVLASTGNTTGLTRDQLLALAPALQRVSTFGDEAILTAETILARFNTLGRETFPRVLQASIDLATRTGDLSGAADTLGRALQRPDLGLRALRSSGVAFTEQVDQQVKALVDNGQILQAQEILLGGVERAYGGAAFAATQTFGGAVKQLQESFGDLLENPGGLQDNVDAVQDLTELLRDPATVQAASDLTGALFTGFQGAVEVITRAVAGIRSISEGLAYLTAGDGADVDRLSARVAALNAQITAYQATADGGGFGSARAGRLLEERRAELAVVQQQLRVLEEFGGFDAPARPAAASPAAPRSGPQGNTPLVPDPQAAARASAAAREAYALLRATVEGELALLRDSVQRELALIDQQAQTSQISFANAADARIAAQTRVVDAEIAARRQQLEAAASEQDRAALIQQITLLEQQRGDVATAARNQQRDAEAALRQELAGLAGDLQRATGNALAADLAQIETRYQDTLTRLRAEGNTAGISLVEQLIGAEQGQARLADFERRVADLQNANAARQQSIANQRTAGVISERRAASELIDANLETADSLRDVVAEYRALALAANDTAALQRIEEIQGAVLTLEDTTSQAARSIAGSLRGGFDDVFATALTDINSVDDALLRLFTNFTTQLSQIAAQDLASSLFGDEGGSGDLLERIGSFLTGGGPAASSGSLFGGGAPAAGGGGFDPGGIGGSVLSGFGSSAEESTGFGSGAEGIGGSLFGGVGTDPAALAEGIGGDLVTAFEEATAAGQALADVGLEWGGAGIDAALELGDTLVNITGAAFDKASALATSFFTTQQTGIVATTATSTAAATTTAATATATNATIAATAAPAAALTSLASFGSNAIPAAIGIALISGAIGALLGGAFAEGGIVEGPGTGTSDSILARISNGEAVIPADVVQNYGEDFFMRLIAGDDPLAGFREGGLINLDMAPRIAGGGQLELSNEAMAAVNGAEPAAAPAAAPGAAAGGVRIVNTLDTQDIANAMDSPAGERTILNVLRRNPSALRGTRS
ncbi:hypothetical protein [Nevskia sp.]|uniref:hypothetical protein n=1 Tax=Nevskia sp. TaxID=1929292 RepID=UPI0025F07578|nr:hypothetical protein [Nevskia sp.]